MLRYLMVSWPFIGMRRSKSRQAETSRSYGIESHNLKLWPLWLISRSPGIGRWCGGVVLSHWLNEVGLKRSALGKFLQFCLPGAAFFAAQEVLMEG